MNAASRRRAGRRAQRSRPRVSERHETEAHDVGRRFARGERGLGRRLTPAAGAGFALPTSPGEPLSLALRGQLEESFGAGLGAIRIHRDTPAQRAAAGLGADAFASGTHIYFSAGRYAPQAEAGRILLGHEVAHVLQQSGRAASDGRTEARPVTGTGDVQCWTSPLTSSIETRTDVQLMAEHLRALTAGAPEAAVITRLMTECSVPVAGGVTYWTVRASYVLSASADPVLGDSPQLVSAPIASALYDGLKISGLTAAAARLLNDRHDLQTLFFSAETYARYVEDFGADFGVVKSRLYEHWNGGGWFGNGTPRFMLDRSMIFLIGPSATNSEQTNRDGTLVGTADQELNRRLSGTLGPDELYFVAVLVAKEVESLRYLLMQRTFDAVRGLPDYDRHERLGTKRTIAQLLRDNCRDIIRRRDELLAEGAGSSNPANSREVLLVQLDDLLPALRDMADFVLASFAVRDAFSTSAISGDPISGTSARARDELAAIDTRLPEYRAKLEEFLHAMLDRNPDGSLAPPAEFARRRDVAARRLGTDMHRIVERPLADQLFAAYPQTGAPSTRGFGFNAAAVARRLPPASLGMYMWALTVVNEFRHAAETTYGADADTRQIARQRSVEASAPATDLRDIVRVRIARRALELAQIAGWNGWAEWVRPIVEGGEIIVAGAVGARDYVALGTDWMLDADAHVSQMAHDLAPQVDGWEPTRTRDLVEFFLAREYLRVADHIVTLLGDNRGVYALGAPPVLNQALELASGAHRPKRYVVRDWEWVTPVDPATGERAPRTQLTTLLMAHPFTRALVRDVLVAPVSDLRWAATGTVIDNHFTAVLWTTPFPFDLVERLRAIPAVSQLVLDALPRLIAELPTLLGGSSPRTPDEQSALRELVAAIETGRAFSVGADPRPAAPGTLGNLTLEMLMALEPDVWWDLWVAVLSVQAGDRRTALLEDIRRAIAASGLSESLRLDREVAFDSAIEMQRRALAHRRRTIVEGQVRPALAAFSAYSEDEFRIPGAGAVTRERDVVRDAAHLLEEFIFRLPELGLEEREGHLAMAVLELAESLHAQLGTGEELGNIYAWVPLLDRALVWADDPAKGGDTFTRDGFTVEEEVGDAALFERRRTFVRQLLTHMARVLSEHVVQWGVVGIRGDGTIESPGSAHPVGDPHRRVSRGTSFTIDGRTWEILEVTEDFWFHPGSFALRSMRGADTGGIGSSKLYIGPGTPTETSYIEGPRPHTLLMRVMLNEGPEVLDVYADQDHGILTDLTWALHMHATLEQLGELADAIETAVNIGMDIAELFPVGGQALAAARLLATAATFFAGEGPALIADLVSNPRQWIDDLVARLASHVSVYNLIGYLLFSNGNLNGLVNEPRRSGTGRYSGGSNRRLRRLLRKVQSLGRGVGRTFARVQDAVQDKRQLVEHTVQSHNRVVWLLQIIADHYLLALAAADEVDRIPNIREAVADFQNNLEDLPTKLSDMIDKLGEIQLPEDILPREALVDVMLDLVGNRLGGKYKLGVQVLWYLIDFVGARDVIVQQIADLLGRAGVRTEILFPMWESDLVPAIRGYLGDAQDALHSTLAGAFERFHSPLEGLRAPEPTVTLSGTEFPEDEVPEVSPMLRDEVRRRVDARAGSSLSAGSAAQMLGRIAAESGEPMTPAVRSDAEARFGEDFSHVRLHDDARAREVTSSLGARALTSGSHVILGDSGEDRVLFHELAHVVQQTGSRAPGLPPRMPRRGRSRRNIRIDASAEAAADAAAAAAMRGTVRGPIPNADAAAWQPNLDIELYGQRFLRQLVDVSAIEAEAADIDESNATTGRRLIGRDVRRTVSSIADNLRAKFQSRALSTTPSTTYHGVRDEISAHLLNSFDDIREAIEDIAIRASFEAEPARDGNPARMQLDIEDFTRRLERYIFGKTGILFHLVFDSRGHGRTATFTSARPYDRAEVRYVFLANVHANTGLWRRAMSHTTAGTPPIASVLTDESERGELRTQIRAVLRDLGPSASVWLPTAFHFTPSIFEAATRLRELREVESGSGTLPIDAPLTVDEYRNTSGAPSAAYGNIRLHLGNYDQKGREQSGRERESHHITQYLLVEYFHNGSSDSPETARDKMAFPLLRDHSDAYGDDMQQRSGVPRRFRDVEIHELEENRGGKMPTILLARPTHRRGSLHINPRAEDFSDAAVSTQSAALNHIYKRALGDVRDIQDAVLAGTRPYSAWVAYRDNPANRVSDRIYDAMQDTYQFMCKFMQPQLRTALEGIERNYFNDRHAQRHPTATEGPMTVGHMTRVFEAAVRHNRLGGNGVRGLQSYGWRRDT